MASDDFTDGDGTALESHDANWTGVNATYPVTTLEINNNLAEHESTFQRSGAYWDGSAEDTSEIVFIGLVGGSIRRHVAVRMDDGGAGTLGYAVFFSVISAGDYTVLAVTKNDVFHDQVGGLTYDITTNHTLVVTVSGVATVSFDEVSVDGNDESGSISDDGSSPIAAGQPGFWTTEAAAVDQSRYDDWNDGAAPPVGGTTNPFSMGAVNLLAGKLA